MSHQNLGKKLQNSSLLKTIIWTLTHSLLQLLSLIYCGYISKNVSGKSKTDSNRSSINDKYQLEAERKYSFQKNEENTVSIMLADNLRECRRYFLPTLLHFETDVKFMEDFEPVSYQCTARTERLVSEKNLCLINMNIVEQIVISSNNNFYFSHILFRNSYQFFSSSPQSTMWRLETHAHCGYKIPPLTIELTW